MHDQDMEFRAAYGEAMFRAHLIEDLLALHIYECSYFHVNDYKGLTRKQIRELEHHERIDELLKIYPNRKDGSIERLVKGLGLLGSIRNKLTHAFIPHGGERPSEAGRRGPDYRTAEKHLHLGRPLLELTEEGS